MHSRGGFRGFLILSGVSLRRALAVGSTQASPMCSIEWQYGIVAAQVSCMLATWAQRRKRILPKLLMPKKTAPNQLVVKRGAVPPSVYLMHISDKEWELFIEDACRHGGRYFQVKRLGNANDKGRDVEARFQGALVADGWDLFQAKHYKDRLTPSEAFPEIAKFLGHLLSKSYPVPRKYYFCAPLNAGPDLHDLLADPQKLRETFLAAWTSGSQGLGPEKAKLTPEMEAFVIAFDFSRFEEYLVHDLLAWHEQDSSAHYKLFGIEPERGDDPEVPNEAQAYEMVYVTELLNVYGELDGTPIALKDVLDSEIYNDHFAAARETFYSAEGLKRFSRDIYLEDEFAKLLDMVRKGIKLKVYSPSLKTGMERHDAAIGAVSSVALTDSALHPRLRGGDLPGTCHHLVNDKHLKWVR